MLDPIELFLGMRNRAIKLKWIEIGYNGGSVGMFSRQGLLLTWKEIRPYFIFSIILFFAGAVIGGTPDAPAEFLEQQIKGIAAIANDAKAADNPEFTMFLLITMNNMLQHSSL